MKLEVRIHGRGGQGVVTAAELLSMAAFDQGLHAQALPSFGSERTGAPVMASCRISDHAIRSHDPVSRPDILVVQDLTLLRDSAVLAGLPDDGTVVVNTNRDLADLVKGGLEPGPAQLWVTVPANDLARELLGRPLPEHRAGRRRRGNHGPAGARSRRQCDPPSVRRRGPGRRRREHPAGRGRSSSRDDPDAGE